MNLPIDNQAAISRILVTASSVKAKHIDVRLTFLCDFLRRGVIAACYLRSELMLADLTTKVHDATKLASLRGMMCIASWHDVHRLVKCKGRSRTPKKVKGREDRREEMSGRRTRGGVVEVEDY